MTVLRQAPLFDPFAYFEGTDKDDGGGRPVPFYDGGMAHAYRAEDDGRDLGNLKVQRRPRLTEEQWRALRIKQAQAREREVAAVLKQRPLRPVQFPDAHMACGMLRISPQCFRVLVETKFLPEAKPQEGNCYARGRILALMRNDRLRARANEVLAAAGLSDRIGPLSARADLRRELSWLQRWTSRVKAIVRPAAPPAPQSQREVGLSLWRKMVRFYEDTGNGG